MRISPLISFRVNLIIYAIFDEDLSQDLSARTIYNIHLHTKYNIHIQNTTYNFATSTYTVSTTYTGIFMETGMTGRTENTMCHIDAVI